MFTGISGSKTFWRTSTICSRRSAFGDPKPGAAGVGGAGDSEDACGAGGAGGRWSFGRSVIGSLRRHGVRPRLEGGLEGVPGERRALDAHGELDDAAEDLELL